MTQTSLRGDREQIEQLKGNILSLNGKIASMEKDNSQIDDLIRDFHRKHVSLSQVYKSNQSADILLQEIFSKYQVILEENRGLKERRNYPSIAHSVQRVE